MDKASIKESESAEQSPLQYEADIAAFGERDADRAGLDGGICCVGSSTMRIWEYRMKKDLYPLSVIPLGFGGSTCVDAVYHFDRLVCPYRPRSVLFYEGDNDLCQGWTVDFIVGQFERFLELCFRFDPKLRVHLISVKPSPDRLVLKKEADALNAKIRGICEADDRIYYVDMVSALLDRNGQVRPELYEEDGVHLKDNGYDLWSRAVADALLPIEIPFEKSIR